MIRPVLLTLLSLMALAANSVLCRLALAPEQTPLAESLIDGATERVLASGAIDPVSFTLLRLVAGVGMLWLVIFLLSWKKSEPQKPVAGGSYRAGFMLFIYALAFSVAYLDLDTGAGALVLFGAVQLTMILAGWLQGQRLHFIEWAGVLLAFSGFVYLVLPGFSTPSFSGFILMTLAGIAWGFYTLKGRGSRTPALDTARNFLFTWPWLLLLILWLLIEGGEWTSRGVILALISGAITSGLGYVIWYATLPFYTGTQAAVLQLSVPVIAAVGGVVFVSEPVTMTLIIASLMILGGIFLVITGRWYLQRTASKAG
ncbi:DMT family transporter [Oceanospirillum sp.]|uniref:DMT family transporter n=1 Tax=Oceanospirillum sp. TaxID=2021254 RepID=UPI003A8EC034